jgi:hypothetical protein
MDINSGSVFIVADVKFDESTLYHEQVKTKTAKIAQELAEQDKDLDIEDEAPMLPNVQPPRAMIQSPKAKEQPPKETTLARAINLLDDKDDDVTPPADSPPQEKLPPQL